jgi:hypothetical protein
VRPHRPGRRAPRHGGRRGRGTGLPGQGQGRRAGADQGPALRRGAAPGGGEHPAPARGGAGGRGVGAPGNVACSRRRCWPAARCGRGRSTGRAAPAR